MSQQLTQCLKRLCAGWFTLEWGPVVIEYFLFFWGPLCSFYSCKSDKMVRLFLHLFCSRFLPASWLNKATSDTDLIFQFYLPNYKTIYTYLINLKIKCSMSDDMGDLISFPWKMQLLEWDLSPQSLNNYFLPTALTTCATADRWSSRYWLALECNWILFLSVLVGCLVGWSLSDISWRPFGRPIFYNVINFQLGKCPILAVWLRPTTNNKQHTNQIHTAC